jgi:ribosomal protein S18 acetylase RimI-like enzyme
VTTTPPVTLRRARPEEAAALAAIPTRAFGTDLAVGAPGPGGPPGYDSPEWQTEAMGWGWYYAVVVDGQLAGGDVVSGLGFHVWHLGRLFLDPGHHGRGIGRRVMELLWEDVPGARCWTLDTPAWNRRTRGFYEALGFVDVGRLAAPGWVPAGAVRAARGGPRALRGPDEGRAVALFLSSRGRLRGGSTAWSSLWDPVSARRLRRDTSPRRPRGGSARRSPRPRCLPPPRPAPQGIPR